MTTVSDQKDEWLTTIEGVLEQARSQNAEADITFFAAVADLLKGQDVELPAENIYHAAWQQIKLGISRGGLPKPLTENEMDPIISNTVTVMTEMPEKQTEWLETVTRRLEDVDGDDAAFLNALIALLKGETVELSPKNTHHVAWQQIQSGIAQFQQPVAELSIDVETMDAIVSSVTAVLSSASDNKVELRSMLNHNRNAAVSAGDDNAAYFFGATVDLLDANGKLNGIQPELDGMFQDAWQRIVAGLEDGD